MTDMTKINNLKSIFRAYDIRGIVNTELTEDIVEKIGRCLGTNALRQKHTKLAVARDGRLSSPVLSQALMRGIRSTGCQVLDIGMAPTPMLYFAAFRYTQGSGIMLTGSHNPSQYNGIKMMIGGKTLHSEAVYGLYDQIQAEDWIEVSEEKKGGYLMQDITLSYQNEIQSDVVLSKPLKVVLDAGNGVAGKIVPDLFGKVLGAEIDCLYCDVDGHFPNHHPDPSKPENLKDLIHRVQEVDADIGLAFDGDGDRLGVVTPKGKVIYADRLIMLFAREILKASGSGLMIFDVKCSQDVPKIIEQYGGEALMYKTGHALMKEKLYETKALFAGEMSGHIFFNDRWPGFDDGLYTGARLLEILANTDKTADELFDEIPERISTPEEQIWMQDESKKFPLMDRLHASSEDAFPDAEQIIKIDGVRVEFSEGWGLVRASNTTPCLVTRFEAQDQSALNKIKARILDWIERTKDAGDAR